ncbi:EF hand [Angomonas deanei]|nr:EF hand [Angomonas deanei]|eukprot:EPY38092.1 EF hand [Angomonas deanei]
MATVFAVDYDDELECPLCLDAWKKPVEASPCGHIFCEECFPQKAKSCPVCRQEIKSTQQPHRSLVNMASNVTVKCQRCGWTGTREVGYSHKCSGPKTPVETGGRVPASAPSNKHLTTYSNYEYDYDYYLSESAPISYTNASHQNNSSSFHAENMAPLKRPSLSDGEPWRKYGLDKKDYEQLSKQFTFFLEGGSTSLNRPQLTKLLRWMNFAHKPQVIADIFAEMDDDGNGLLDINEFLTWVGKNQPPPDRLYGFSLATYGKIMMEFNMFDLDEDGLLNVEDFTDMMVSTGQEKDLDRIAAIFRNLDNNNYGLISLNDYLAFRKGTSVVEL